MPMIDGVFHYPTSSATHKRCGHEKGFRCSCEDDELDEEKKDITRELDFDCS